MHQTEEIVLGNTVTSMSLVGKHQKKTEKIIKKSMKAQLLAKTMDPTSSKRPKNNQNIIQNPKKKNIHAERFLGPQTDRHSPRETQNEQTGC